MDTLIYDTYDSVGLVVMGISIVCAACFAYMMVVPVAAAPVTQAIALLITGLAQNILWVIAAIVVIAMILR